MKFKTEGLIINEQAVGESDKLVTVLTASLGVIRAFVRGAKNIKSHKCAATGLLCLSELGIYKSKDKYMIDEASVKEMFVRLRTDVLKMSYAQYLCELAQKLCPREQPAKEQLRLISNAVYLLACGKKSPKLVKACTEMRLLSLSGYMPNLLMCGGCGVYEAPTMYFSAGSGRLLCSDCFAKKPELDAAAMNIGVLRALRHTVYSDFEKLFSFELSEKGLEDLNRITEAYLVRITEYDFKTLQFLKFLE